jgi:phosphoribosylformylglycinamidine (FGAM) synthase PurS component
MREWLMKYWLQVLFGAVVAGFTALYRKKIDKIKQQKELELKLEQQRAEEFELLKDAIKAVLRGQIVQSYNHCLDRGEVCRIYEKENVEELYNSYHALGGNGVIDGIYKDLMEMKTQ